MAEKFRSKQDLYEVEVNQVLFENYEAVAHWCEGVSVVEHDALSSDVHYPAINVPCGGEMKRAQTLNWVVRYPTGRFDVFYDALFRMLFEPIT